MTLFMLTNLHSLFHILNESFPNPCVLVRPFSSNTSLPLHLDHDTFGDRLLVLTFADTSTRLHIYDTQRHLRYAATEGTALLLSDTARYRSFLHATSKSSKRSWLVLVASLAFSSCRCDSPFCMTRILHHPREREEVQTAFVDRAYRYFCSYFASSTTKFFKPVNAFIRSFTRGLLLDTGCGDCKYICRNEQLATQSPNRRSVIIGQDNNASMLRIHKYPQWNRCLLLQSDICRLPFR